MDLGDGLLLAGAGLVAGAVNSVAGGGSLLSFPALLAVGYAAVPANVTNIVALLPGYLGGALAYRAELAGQRARARRMSATSAVGAVAGSALLLASPASLFESLVPFLILAACALLAAQPLLPSPHPCGEDRRAAPWVVGLAAVYGGYFGAALGVMLLAVLGLLTSEDVQRANGLKALLSLVIGVVSAVFLAIFGPVAWGPAAVMAVASLVGGRAGGALARRLSPVVLRWTVVAIGTVLAVIFFARS